jgi:RNA polymerase sigma-70 factor (ECF subfamily)
LKSANDHAWNSDLSHKWQYIKENNVRHEHEEKFDGLDAEAYLAEVIRLYGGLVRHICRNALGDRPEDVDECVSDSFVALWEKAKGGGYDPNTGDVKQYLCGIARNKAIDRYRKIIARPATLALSDADEGVMMSSGTLSEPDIAELLAKGDDEALMVEAVGNLPSPDREIFVLRYFYLDRVKAIAEKLDMTEKAVQNRLYRGKLSLRRQLSGDGFGSGSSAQNRQDKDLPCDDRGESSPTESRLREGRTESHPDESRLREVRVESHPDKKHSKEDYEVIIYG